MSSPQEDAKVALGLLTRIADALDRAFPIPKPSGHLKPGMAQYAYEDPQTAELRRQFEKAPANGPKE